MQETAPGKYPAPPVAFSFFILSFFNPPSLSLSHLEVVSYHLSMDDSSSFTADCCVF